MALSERQLFTPTPERAQPGSPRTAGRKLLEKRLPDWAPTALSLVGIYSIVRVILLVADLLAAHVGYGGHLDGPLTAWDSHFYIQIAKRGYPAVSPRSGGHLTYSAAGFEPVFPLLIRLVTATTFSYVTAALVVSLIGGLVGTLLVWRLATALRGELVGFNAAVLFVVFPGMATAWGMFYSESVALALVAGCLLLIFRERWLWAGIVGALATATSPLALPLAVAALVPAIRSVLNRKRPDALITVLLVPLGFVAFVAYLGARYHDLLYWWHLQNQAWGATVDFGKGLILQLPHFWAGGYVGKSWLEWIGIAAVAAALVVLWRAKLPGFINAYCVAVFLLLLVSNQLGFKPRLLAWAFPALIAVAAIARGRAWQAVAIGFAVLLPIVLLAYTTLGNTMIQP